MAHQLRKIEPGTFNFSSQQKNRAPSLQLSLNWPASRWRVLDAAHQKRNLAEYEGFLDVEESALAELCALVAELIAGVAKLIES